MPDSNTTKLPLDTLEVDFNEAYGDRIKAITPTCGDMVRLVDDDGNQVIGEIENDSDGILTVKMDRTTWKDATIQSECEPERKTCEACGLYMDHALDCPVAHPPVQAQPQGGTSGNETVGLGRHVIEAQPQDDHPNKELWDEAFQQYGVGDTDRQAYQRSAFVHGVLWGRNKQAKDDVCTCKPRIQHANNCKAWRSTRELC